MLKFRVCLVHDQKLCLISGGSIELTLYKSATQRLPPECSCRPVHNDSCVRPIELVDDNTRAWEILYLKIKFLKAMNEVSRFTWAAKIVNAHHTDYILEIGCGAGLLVEQIAKSIEGGRILGIDQSGAMLKHAEKRNAELVQKEKAKFIKTKFLELNLPLASFDKIVAFNIPFFLKSPLEELKLIKKLLSPNGTLFIFYQAPYPVNDTSSTPIIKGLTSGAFRILDVVIADVPPHNALVVIAQPNT